MRGCSSHHQYILQCFPCQAQHALVLTWHSRYIIDPITDIFPLYFSHIHYPYDPMQPGPIYFLTPQKCSIFGVCCESVPCQ